jgi:hypothetical protein
MPPFLLTDELYGDLADFAYPEWHDQSGRSKHSCTSSSVSKFAADIRGRLDDKADGRHRLHDLAKFVGNPIGQHAFSILGA